MKKAEERMMLVTDEQTITAVRYGIHAKYPCRFWDDGFGPLWVYQESLGVMGVVRAANFEDAYECVTDEIMHGVTWAEMLDEVAGNDEQQRAEIEDAAENGHGLPEGYQWRPNGEPSNAGIHGEIASEDLNGSALDELTPELAELLGIEVDASTD